MILNFKLLLTDLESDNDCEWVPVTTFKRPEKIED